MRTDRVDDEQALRELYAASYARLVGVVGAVCGSTHEAEEAVQDAFVRLMGQWPKVSRYGDPEAWVRKAALGYASNRRRKALNGLTAVLKRGPPPTLRPLLATTWTCGARSPRCSRPSGKRLCSRTWAWTSPDRPAPGHPRRHGEVAPVARPRTLAPLLREDVTGRV